MNNIYKLMDDSIKQLNEVKDRLLNHDEEDMAINIILADDEGVEPLQVFVEIENDAGQSIRIGAELTTEEGYRKIRISTSDIINHMKI